MKQKITKYEQVVLIPKIISDFRKDYSRFNPISSAEYCDILRADGYHIQDVTFRKLVKYIQFNCLLKFIIADTHGFYRTTSKSILKKQIESLLSREQEIKRIRVELQRQLRK